MGNTSTLSEVSKATLSANTTLSQNLGKANQVYDGISAQADDDIDNLLASAFETLRSTGFDGVTGLELDQVQGMQDAITAYVAAIQEALSPLNAADAQNVFGKEIAPHIENFVIEVKNSCSAVISNMLSFNDDLSAIKTAMEAKKTSVNSVVDATSNDLQSSTSGWKYSGSGESN